jgi:methylmalonyl-CoA mutase N-terminal domain/subunit
VCSSDLAYVKAAIEAGLAVDEFAPRLSFFFNAHNHLFEEVAKFRAARRMWARIMREEFGARDPESWMLRFHTQTAGSMLTSQQPENNVVRVTLQALAAVLGGTQSLHTNARDEALGLPTEDSARVALRTQQILGAESGAAEVIDPLGGAPYVESLTDELEARALALLAEIERRGGPIAAIETGFVQRQIHESAMAWQRSVEKKTRPIVGVNVYTEKEAPAKIFKPDPRSRDEVLADLADVRRRRDAARVDGALRALAEAARSKANLVAAMVPAVECYTTLGEICGVLEKEFGVYKAVDAL